MLRYSAQYVDDVAKALEENTERNNTVALGSSGIGLMSGITGAAAAAVHIAAAAAAGAAILSPAGPPLFIASLIFGGTAAAASTSSEAVSYYSEPNQMANRLMALHELINSLLQVTVVLGDALVNGRINLDHYVDRMQRKKDEKKKRAKLAATAEDGDEKKDESETVVEEEEEEAEAESENESVTTDHGDNNSANNKDGETKADNAKDVLVSTEADETAIINQFMAEASGEVDEETGRMAEKEHEEKAAAAETDDLDE